MTRRGWSLVTHAGSTGAEVRVDGGSIERWFPTTALTRVVDQ